MRIKNLIRTGIFLAVLSGAVIVSRIPSVQGAIYGFVQDRWDGGPSSSFATQTGWDKYHSKGDNITADPTTGEVELSPLTTTFTDNFRADFTGTFNNAEAVTAGTVDQVQLVPTINDPFVKDQLGEWLTLPSIPALGRFSSYTKMGNFIYMIMLVNLVL